MFIRSDISMLYNIRCENCGGHMFPAEVVCRHCKFEHDLKKNYPKVLIIIGPYFFFLILSGAFLISVNSSQRTGYARFEVEIGSISLESLTLRLFNDSSEMVTLVEDVVCFVPIADLFWAEPNFRGRFNALYPGYSDAADQIVILKYSSVDEDTAYDVPVDSNSNRFYERAGLEFDTFDRGSVPSADCWVIWDRVDGMRREANIPLSRADVVEISKTASREAMPAGSR